LSLLSILNQLFQYSLVRSYTPIVGRLGFSHPLTFVLITAHNTFSLTYLLLTATVAHATLRRKTWLLLVAIMIVWTLVGVGVVATLEVSTATAVAAILPHGWLEYTALIYWINAIRRVTKRDDAPVPASTPALGDYFRAMKSPVESLKVLKADLAATFTNTKRAATVFFRDLRKAYAITLMLIAVAALLETYLTPYIMLFIDKL
jgi:hypothetical protein